VRGGGVGDYSSQGVRGAITIFSEEATRPSEKKLLSWGTVMGYAFEKRGSGVLNRQRRVRPWRLTFKHSKESGGITLQREKTPY